jgi:hypothetical protein
MEENLNPFAKSRKPLFRSGGGSGGGKQKAPPGGVGLSWRSLAPGKDYLAGALDVSLGLFEDEDDDVDFLCFL